ncbi:CAP domain-containing protein [Priestia sp. YIM B13551]|uniref:CAP domain-containing protein n=1 Tax=Priestia sp. YIM B13551 TaxID=3366306 RepID=UPI00366D7385
MKKTIIASTLALSILGGAAATNASAMTMYKEPPFEAYKVTAGDTFYFIAKRYGLDYKKLQELNPSVNPTNMKIGSIIRLKPATTSTNTNTGTTTSNSSANAVSTSSMTISAYEKQVGDLVNQERAKAGLKPLTINAELSRVARYKSADMHDKGYFDHTSPTYGSPFDMMKSFGISYKSAGENIAYGQKTPKEVMESWMNSSGHRANILNANYTDLGIGYLSDKNYWTQQFIGK